MIAMIHAQDPAEIEQVKVLFREYQAFLGISLDFQDFEAELAALPGRYAPPQGRLFLALKNNQPIGCGALYPFQPPIAEIKRLYVRPTAQGTGIGRQLFETLLDAAQEIGYQQVYLDSLKRLDKAYQLYQRFGFEEISPYNQNPHPDVYYMAKTL